MLPFFHKRTPLSTGFSHVKKIGLPVPVWIRRPEKPAGARNAPLYDFGRVLLHPTHQLLFRFSFLRFLVPSFTFSGLVSEKCMRTTGQHGKWRLVSSRTNTTAQARPCIFSSVLRRQGRVRNAPSALQASSHMAAVSCALSAWPPLARQCMLCMTLHSGAELPSQRPTDTCSFSSGLLPT